MTLGVLKYKNNFSYSLAQKVNVEMKNIALIYFTVYEEKNHKRVFFISIFRKLKKLFAIRKKPISINKLEVDSNYTVHTVKLSYTLNELEKAGRFTRRKISKHIIKMCKENSIDKCIIPNDLPFPLDFCEKSHFTGKIIYTVMAVDIIEHILKLKEFDIRDVDIAIIQGDNEVLPCILIKLLSPVVKFITLVTKEKELVEKNIEEVCDETGLSVRITNDAAGVLVSSDIVINYGDLKNYGIKKKVVSNAIIINYGELDENRLGHGNDVINRIDIGLGDKYRDCFEDSVFKSYCSSEIAEIVLINKTNFTINNLEDLTDYKIIDKLIKYIKEEGFYIKDYL